MTSVSVSVTNRWSVLTQALFELEIVFDDAVVDDDDASGAIAMRMRVLFGWTSVVAQRVWPMP